MGGRGGQLFLSPTDSNPIYVPKSCRINKLTTSMLPLVNFSPASLKYSRIVSLKQKLEHTFLAELSACVQQDNKMVDIFEIFSGRKWNYRLEVRRPALIATRQ